MGHRLQALDPSSITLREVKFSYVPKARKIPRVWALSGVNLKISSRGEAIGIVGHTGSGKSTLVQILNALLRPEEGEADLFGTRVTRKNKVRLKPIRQKAGLCFQFPEYQLFAETVLKDIAYGPRNFGFPDPETSARQAAREIAVPEEILPSSPFALSGGQMRKVAIAGILASNPDVLILDEPTVGLDPASREELVALLNRITHEEGRTLVMITHNMSVMAQVCDRVIVMKEGRVAYDGSKDALFHDDDICRQYHIDYPRAMRILTSLKEKMNLTGLDVHQYSLPDAAREIARVLGEER